MREQLAKIKSEALAAIAGSENTAALDGVRVKYLGKKGELTAVLKQMGKLSAEERPVIGQIANEVRETLTQAIAAQNTTLAEKALEEVLPLLKPGAVEREIAAEITYRMRLHGAEGNSFDPIVVTGAKSSMPHGVPGDEVIKSGDFVTMDFGCVKDGYCSDMTRTVAIGSATDEMRNVYYTVLEAQKAGIAVARPGVTGAEIHNAGAKVIADAGYGAYFGHGFGHGVGLDIHEQPTASPANQRPMPEGAVISAEPGIYLPGKFGVRIEDVLYLSGEGCVDITKAPKDLLIL